MCGTKRRDWDNWLLLHLSGLCTHLVLALTLHQLGGSGLSIDPEPGRRLLGCRFVLHRTSGLRFRYAFLLLALQTPRFGSHSSWPFPLLCLAF